MPKNNYNENTIQILEGLEAVRKRPGMYIGSTDSRGLHHLVWEIFDNAIDEALAGYGDNIQVILNLDGSITVQDHGRGMPTGIHESGKPTTEVIMTILHAGGKFSEDGGYKTAGGLHGVGASVVNALSSWVILTVERDGKIFQQKFSNGGSTVGPLEVIGTSKNTGTKIQFMPDSSIFSTIRFNYNTIKERLRESAFLLKGIKIDVIDEITNQESSFKYDDGLESFVAYLNEEKDSLGPVINISGQQNDIAVEIALQYTSTYQETILSFVNTVRTVDGGTHETGFKSALTRVFNEYARKYNLLKEKDKNLEGGDIREGVSVIISTKVPERILQFESQTKSKLGTPLARNVVDSVVYENLTFFLEENKVIAEQLINKMIKAASVRNAARKARDEMRSGKTKKERNLSGKLAPAQSKSKANRELYIVEGDSAGGSAKQGRDRKNQAILPLRGKVLNTQKASIDQIMANEELSTLIYTIGAGVGSDFDANDSNYDKVIIMTDADTDGAHIQILLLTFFYRYMRDLVKAGKVYIALPPLYKVSKKIGKQEKVVYAWEDYDLEQAKKEVGKGYSVQRYKGLGEMNAQQLWDTTMNPETRTLIKVSIEDMALVERKIDILMGENAEPRREWIEENVQFSLEDDFRQ